MIDDNQLNNVMRTPTIEEIEEATPEELANWWANLPLDSFPENEAGDLFKQKVHSNFDNVLKELKRIV